MPKKTITKIIDFFYPPFRKIMPVQTFRYAACGGANVFFGNFILFAVLYNILHREYGKEMVVLGYVLKTYNLAFLISSVVTFVIGFLLNKYVVFVSSHLRGRIQLFRYFLSFLLNVFLNYILLKVFVELLKVGPVLSQRIVTIINIAVSYYAQRHFTFHTKKQQDIRLSEEPEEEPHYPL